MKLEEIISDGTKIMQSCFDAVVKILGRRPQNEEIAMVNSLFIHTVKEMYFSKQRGVFR